LPPVSFEEILTFLNKRRGLIDGIVLSGGEPTLHRNLQKIVETVHSMGLKVKLDTNGLNPSVVKNFRVDYLAVDIKTAPPKYKSLGYPVSDCEERLKESIDIVRTMGEKAEIRVPCASGFIDNEIAEEIAKLVSGVKKVFLQRINYNVEFLDNSFKDVIPVTEEQLLDFQKIISPCVGNCTIR
jgi:pyruvate formate lyase activating enzyme